MQAELLIDAKAQLGEGPFWDERQGVLYWLDVLSGTLNRYHPSTQNNVTYDVRQHIGCAVLNEDGAIWVAVRDGFGRFYPETDNLVLINDPEAHLPNNRFNDGAADPAGRFWAGTMAYDVTPHAGSLYRLDADMSVQRMESDVTISNGIAWSKDQKTMYYVDSPPGVIYAFDYDTSTGNSSDGRIVIKVPPEMGFPDGMAIDSKDQLWVAHWGYGAVVCWCPKTGEIMDEVRVPASQTSSCAFGGDDLKTLYITTAREGLSDEQLAKEPHAGGIFSVRTEIAGVPSFRTKF